MSSPDYDGLNLCEVCGDAYTTGKLCTACARQKMIDNADLSEAYYGEEYIDMWQDMPYGGDMDHSADYLDMYDDDDGSPYEMDYESYQGDFGEERFEYRPTLRTKLLFIKWRIADHYNNLAYVIEQCGGLRPYLRWKLRTVIQRWEHRLRMRFDKPYRSQYDDIPF